MAMASYGRGGAQNRKGRVCTAMRYIELARKYEMDTLDEGAPNWNERREFSEAQDCVALVLDDVGVRRATDFGLDALQWLVDYRWKNSLETLATSNLSPGELAQRLDDRIVSRLCGFGKVEHMDGPDRRLQGA
jgi:DNA replication protein DnaC